jgi:tetratricopeptide (TPR) repeat protein
MQDAAGKTTNAAGYFLPRPFRNWIVLDATAGGDTTRLVYHELFHAIMDASLGSGTLPVWLSEGLAEYFSTFVSEPGSTSVSAGHPIEEHLQYLELEKPLPWDEVFRTTHDSPAYNEKKRQGAFYAQSWLVVHYLNGTEEGGRAINRYLTLLRAGTDEPAAFAEAFGRTREALAAEVDRYRKEGRKPSRRWEFDDDLAEVPYATEPVAEAELLFRLGELLGQRGQADAAAAHFDRAAAAGWPAADVTAGRGAAAYYAERKDEAARLLRQAADAGASSEEPYVLLSWILSERAGALERRAKGPVPPAILEIRALLERAIEKSPDSLVALTGLARTYWFDDPDLTPAIAALDRAAAAGPLDVETLQVRAALLAHAGEIGPAWQVIDRDIASRDPHRARATVDLFASGVQIAAAERAEAGDTERATSMLDEAIAAIGEPTATEELRRMRDALGSGRRLLSMSGDAATVARKEGAIAEFNRGVELANGGSHAEALAVFEEIAEACVEPDLCEAARGNADGLRAALASERFGARLREAAALANGGNDAAAIAILRELEQAPPSDEAREHVRGLLRALGAEPSTAD